MSVSKCMQHLPGTLWRWRFSLLFAALLSLVALGYLQTSSDLVRLARRPSWLDPARHRSEGVELPRTPEVWDERPAHVRASPRRVVHLDLKGAPPTAAYLTRLLPLIRRLGGTGLLLEWEDMFPFSGALRPAAARNHYSRAEVRRILAEARRQGLQVIPLVQTFGHLELFLKLEPFAHLRETPAQPAALCPSRNESFRLVQKIVDQVMEMHRGTPFLHIGCDEVYHMGVCELCRTQMRDDLYLEHVTRVARYVRERYNARPLIWDDMMRHIPGDVLRRSGIAELVEPMVWVYAEDVYRFVGPNVYDAFAEVFPHVWGASAYKGAFGETLTVPPITRHLDNTLNWLDVMRREGPKFSEGFRGLVLTGWQRYDHMAVLCELLPAAIPSLAVSLVAASHGFFNSSLQDLLYNTLGCPSAPHELLSSLATDPQGSYAFSACDFPGSEFFKFTGQLESAVAQAEEFFATATQRKGWLTEYNINRNYTNPFRVDEVLEMFYSVQYTMKSAVSSARDALQDVVDRYTVAEWVEQHALAQYGLNVSEAAAPRRPGAPRNWAQRRRDRAERLP
ncbi:hexosaminidase D-like [Pollicipes pollicipes]|uniref:hexosaminidase D-like n=1 Tax=Pollicipes pollicipes TaxID=41117 RepID=UPI0018856829|nr:hexosaminidase D-like [Pollicipes pollicipes]